MRTYPVPHDLTDELGPKVTSVVLLAAAASHPDASVRKWASAATDAEVARPLVAAGCDPGLGYYGIMDDESDEPLIVAVVSLDDAGELRRWNGSGWDVVPADLHPVGMPFVQLDDELLAAALTASGGLLLRPTTPKAAVKGGVVSSGRTVGHYAIVDEFDTAAVLDFLRVDAGPKLFVRRGGVWEPDSEMLSRLKSVDPPTVVAVPEESVAAVTEQVDQYDADATTASAWAGANAGPILPASELRRRAAAERAVWAQVASGRGDASGIYHEMRTRDAADRRARDNAVRAAWDDASRAAVAVVAASYAGGGSGSVSNSQKRKWDESRVTRDKDPGEQGRFTTPDDGDSHTMEEGETLEDVAKANGLSLEELLRANPSIKDPKSVKPGTKLKLPEGEMYQPTPEKKKGGSGGGGGGGGGGSAKKAAAKKATPKKAAAKKVADPRVEAARKQADAAKKQAAERKAKYNKVKAAAAIVDSQYELEQARDSMAESERRRAVSAELRAKQSDLLARQAEGENVGAESAELRAAAEAERKARSDYDEKARAAAERERIRRMEVRIELQRIQASLTAAAVPEHSMMPRKLKHYWTRGKGAAKIRWGTGGDFNRCRRALAKYLRPDQIGGACANLHKAATGTWPGKGRHHGVTASAAPTHAGIAMIAGDTGRVLLLQRSIHDEEDPARGTWEFPGGGIEESEGALDAARREWSEETGCEFPAAARQAGVWDSPDGVYRGHIMLVPSEKDVSINSEAGRVLNPDDPDGDDIEVSAWFDLEHLPTNPALRQEVKNTNWAALSVARLSTIR